MEKCLLTVLICRGGSFSKIFQNLRKTYSDKAVPLLGNYNHQSEEASQYLWIKCNCFAPTPVQIRDLAMGLCKG